MDEEDEEEEEKAVVKMRRKKSWGRHCEWLGEGTADGRRVREKKEEDSLNEEEMEEYEDCQNVERRCHMLRAIFRKHGREGEKWGREIRHRKG